MHIQIRSIENVCCTYKLG